MSNGNVIFKNDDKHLHVWLQKQTKLMKKFPLCEVNSLSPCWHRKTMGTLLILTYDYLLF